MRQDRAVFLRRNSDAAVVHIAEEPSRKNAALRESRAKQSEKYDFHITVA